MDILLAHHIQFNPRGAARGVNITPLLTHESAAVARLARRLSKALNEYFSRIQTLPKDFSWGEEGCV